MSDDVVCLDIEDTSKECLESGTVIFEAKDGAYEPLGEENVLNRNS